MSSFRIRTPQEAPIGAEEEAQYKIVTGMLRSSQPMPVQEVPRLHGRRWGRAKSAATQARSRHQAQTRSRLCTGVAWLGHKELRTETRIRAGASCVCVRAPRVHVHHYSHYATGYAYILNLTWNIRPLVTGVLAYRGRPQEDGTTRLFTIPCLLFRAWPRLTAHLLFHWDVQCRCNIHFTSVGRTQIRCEPPAGECSCSSHF
jgi:hypothetical protein